MAGTITTYSRAAVKNGVGYEGTTSEIVLQVCNDLRFIGSSTAGWTVYYSITGYGTSILSYTEGWTYDEVVKDASLTIFNKLKDYGFRLYRDIGFQQR